MSCADSIRHQSPAPGPEIAIRVQNLSKIYKLYKNPMDRLKESLNPFHSKYHKDFYALNDVSFEIERGDTVGIIGKNGSGKSTLLKIITGILTPSSGNVQINGKISALLELGAGFNSEMTGIENVYFNGTLMGYTREEMNSKLDDILAFADIGAFVEQPVKMYSSGMFVRLAFALAVNVEPEILIVDEALSVGDVFFQQKCYDKIREKINCGTTCLFVSHDTAAIMNICRRTFLFENGQVVFDGVTKEAVSRYSAIVGDKNKDEVTKLDGCELVKLDPEITVSDVRTHSLLSGNVNRHGAGGLIIDALRVTDQRGQDTLNVSMMGKLNVILLVRALSKVNCPGAGIHLFDRFGNLVFAAGTSQLGLVLPDLEPEQELEVRFQLCFSVQPGEYTFSVGVAEPSTQGRNIGYVHDRIDSLGPIVVNAGINEFMPFFGIARLPLTITASQIVKAV